MSIRTKLLSAIAACILGFLLFAGLSWNTVSTVKVNGDRYGAIVQGKDLIADILPPPEYIVEPYLLAYQMANETDAERVREARQRFDGLRKDFDDRHAYWTQNLPGGPLKDLLVQKSYAPAKRFFDVVERELLPALGANDRARAQRVIAESLDPLYREHRAAITETVGLADQGLKAEERATAEIVSSRGRWMALLAALVFVLMLLSGYIVNGVTSMIVVRLGKAVGMAEAMAGGDMRHSLEVGQNDEVGRLVGALNGMQANMRQVVTDIDAGVRTLMSSSESLSAVSMQTASTVGELTERAATVAAAAEESSANAGTVASGATAAARNLESVASATEEMNSTVVDIAASSERARVISEQAQAQAAGVHGMMQQLGQAAHDIGAVTETIKSIAAQTSLLALNATIEAARAGASGKGFAVVASEVKELSRQAAAASEDIKAKVDGVQSSVGAAIGDIEKIAGVINDMGALVSSIAAGIEEQAVVTRDVASHIAQASSGVHDVSARVNETAAVSQEIARDIARVNAGLGEIREAGQQVRERASELSNVAGHLNSRVATFKVA